MLSALESYNQALFLLLNAGQSPSPILLQGALVSAQWLVYGLLFVLVVLWLWGGAGRGWGGFREVALKALLAVVLGFSLVCLIRWYWPHPRPFVIGLGYTYLQHAPDSSFPSNHAVFSFSIAFTFLLNKMRKSGLVLLVVALLICWSRVFLGVHYPLDMVGAFLLAITGVWLIKHLYEWGGRGLQLLALLETFYRWLLAVPIAKGWVAR